MSVYIFKVIDNPNECPDFEGTVKGNTQPHITEQNLLIRN